MVTNLCHNSGIVQKLGLSLSLVTCGQSTNKPSAFLNMIKRLSNLSVLREKYVNFQNNNKYLLSWESLFNMTRGGGGKDSETRSLKFQQPPSLAVQFFRSPTPFLLDLKYTNFRSHPPSPKIHSELPSQVSKNFRTPSISSSPPPCHIK